MRLQHGHTFVESAQSTSVRVMHPPPAHPCHRVRMTPRDAHTIGDGGRELHVIAYQVDIHLQHLIAIISMADELEVKPASPDTEVTGINRTRAQADVLQRNGHLTLSEQSHAVHLSVARYRRTAMSTEKNTALR